jgi:hypothetical protein
MRGHMSLHRATTKYFSNSFVFKIARDLASMGKIQGTLRISRLIDLRKCKSVNHALGSAGASSCLPIVSSFVG